MKTEALQRRLRVGGKVRRAFRATFSGPEMAHRGLSLSFPGPGMAQARFLLAFLLPEMAEATLPANFGGRGRADGGCRAGFPVWQMEGGTRGARFFPQGMCARKARWEAKRFHATNPNPA